MIKKFVLITLLTIVSIPCWSADKALLIYAFPKDAAGSSLGEETFEVWKSDWEDYAEKEYAWKFSQKYNSASINFAIVYPEYHYLYYTSEHKNGRKRVFLPRSRSSERIEKDKILFESLVEKNGSSKTTYTYVLGGQHPLKLRGRDTLLMSNVGELHSQPLNKYAKLIATFNDYKEGSKNECPNKDKEGNKIEFTLHQEYSGIIKFTDKSGSIARLNMRSYFKYNKPEGKILGSFKNNLFNILKAVCGNEIKDRSLVDEYIKEPFNDKFNKEEGKMRSYIRKLMKENQQRLYKKCVDAKKASGICNEILSPRKAPLGEVG